MNPINKVYGDFVIDGLIGWDIILCGTLTFKGRSKDIDELNWRMDQFKVERLEKYKISSRCYWVVEKMNNFDNHIHLMIGIRKDNYKGVDDYRNIFGGYWKIFGSCLFVEYDGEKGLFGDYMFKGFDEWEFFETEFGNLNNLDKFVQNKTNIIWETKRLGLLQFVRIIEDKKINK